MPAPTSTGQSLDEALADAPMFENRPTSETAKLLKDELLFQRATQTYLWTLPLINTLGMKVWSEKTFGAGYNDLPVWKERQDAKTLVTRRTDVIYAMSYLDLSKEGPMVFEAAPGLQGIGRFQGRRLTGAQGRRSRRAHRGAADQSERPRPAPRARRPLHRGRVRPGRLPLVKAQIPQGLW
jgi:hypothetical protein